MRRSENLWRNAITPTDAQFSAKYKILRGGDKLRVALFVRDDKFLEATAVPPTRERTPTPWK